MTWENDRLRLIISIEQNTLDDLFAIGKQHFPNEFGGFLIGYYSDDKKQLHITDHILPIKYKGTPTLFERESISTTSELQRFYAMNPQKYYVGEWHTHPHGSPSPSITDFRAMKEISEDAEVAIKNPVLIIIGRNYTVDNIGVFAFFENKLFRYE